MSTYTIQPFHSRVDDIIKYEVKRDGKYIIGYVLTVEEANALAAADSRPKHDKDIISRDEYYRRGLGDKDTYYGDGW